jgi:hypothetical protein
MGRRPAERHRCLLHLLTTNRYDALTLARIGRNVASSCQQCVDAVSYLKTPYPVRGHPGILGSIMNERLDGAVMQPRSDQR